MYYDIVSEPDMTVQDDFAFEYAIPEQEISKEIVELFMTGPHKIFFCTNVISILY